MLIAHPLSSPSYPTFNQKEEESDFIITYGSLGLCQALAYLAAVLQVRGITDITQVAIRKNTFLCIFLYKVNRRTLDASSKIHRDIFHKVLTL